MLIATPTDYFRHAAAFFAIDISPMLSPPHQVLRSIRLMPRRYDEVFLRRRRFAAIAAATPLSFTPLHTLRCFRAMPF